MSATMGEPKHTASKSFRTIGKDVDDLTLANFMAAHEVLKNSIAAAAFNCGVKQQPARCFSNQHYFPIGATTCICGKVQAE